MDTNLANLSNFEKQHFEKLERSSESSERESLDALIDGDVQRCALYPAATDKNRPLNLDTIQTSDRGKVLDQFTRQKPQQPDAKISFYGGKQLVTGIQ